MRLSATGIGLLRNFRSGRLRRWTRCDSMSPTHRGSTRSFCSSLRDLDFGIADISLRGTTNGYSGYYCKCDQELHQLPVPPGQKCVNTVEPSLIC